MGGLCPLFFDGAVCSFTELPHPKLTAELTKVYKYAESIRIAPVKTFLMVSLRKIITRLQGWN